MAVANQKGGVAKTTTVHALGFATTELGRRRRRVTRQRSKLRGLRVEQHAVAAGGEKRSEPGQRFDDPRARMAPDQRDRGEGPDGGAHDCD